VTSKVNQRVSGLIMLYTQAITNALGGAGRREREQASEEQVCCDLSCRRRQIMEGMEWNCSRKRPGS
jgi:hypothetical protein